MPTKVILLINGQNPLSASIPALGTVGQAHSWGCSESFWYNGGISATLTNLLRTQVGPGRAGLLAQGAQVLGARLYQDGAGRGVTVPLGFPGIWPSINVAQDALLCSTTDPAVNPQRKFWLHAVPDGQIVFGEFNPIAQYVTNLTYYLAVLSNSGQWRSIIRNNLIGIVSVTSAGLVTFTGNNPFAVGQQITITRVLMPDGRRFGGKFTVATVGPLATQITITGWPQLAGLGGQAYVASYGLRSLGNGSGIIVERAGIKKLGRPFDLYRGRKSVRRRVA